ncbi:MAG: PQQ-binding-like beta-propeller repeat protein [Planctomycetaceae bacterium]|nr:PQQ-binding-like beta-propeller repeat protein [Planctomycetaceae bacterium]
MSGLTTPAKTKQMNAVAHDENWKLLILVFSLAISLGCAPQRQVPDSNATTSQVIIPTETKSIAVQANDRSIAADPLDWTVWRGPNYNGVSLETELIDDFDPRGGEGSNVAWKREDLGGRSTPIVMDGKLYTMIRAEPGTEREGEKVVCVDAKTGETLWENRFNVYLSDVPDTRVGWSSCVGDPETGSIYAQGVCGHFQCIDAKTGKTKWMVPLHERFGLLSTYGGRTNFPVICDDLVITSAIVIGWGDMAKPAHRFIGFDKRTGEVVWFSGTRLLPYDTTYSGPTLTVLDDQKALVFGSGDGGVWAIQPRTGQPIWKYQLSRRGVNASPLVVDETVYAGHSEENTVGTSMGAIVSIDTTQADDAKSVVDLTSTGENWRIDEVMAGRTQPLFVNDNLWVFDDRAKLQVFDAKSGEPVGRRIALGRMMRSSPLQADGKVYAFSANGRWSIYEPDEKKGARVINKGRLPSGEECHASPICSHGRIYVQSTGALYCLQDPEKQSKAVEQPAKKLEANVAEDPAPAHVQLVPAEVLMKPGQMQTFQVRLFNSRGQQLDEATTAELSLEGPGQISPDGKFTAAKDAAHQATVVTAKVGSLKGTARIRVVPDLPWNFTFSNGEIPITWVGARYRHVPLDDKLFGELNQQDPLAAQLYLYLSSAFTNTGRPKLIYDNSTPQQKWSALQRFLGTDATTLEQAQAQLDPALTRLIDKDFLKGIGWETLPNIGVQLMVEKGSRAFSGKGVMTKIKTIPKGTRSRCWFGQSDLSNYTIQANVRAATKDNKLPDIGLIAQGYAIDLQGASQKLQIRSWVPQLRMAQTIDFPWEADRWYTMKFRASVENGQAILRGKVWPQDETEPTDWTIEATDDSPNHSGSPGLFGNAKDAEIFLDDVTVTAN